MKIITVNDLFLNGLNSIKELDEFEFSYNTYSNEHVRYEDEFKNLKLVKSSDRTVGKDFENGRSIWRKKTQDELDFENLQFQIQKLEERFKIKISYTSGHSDS